MMWTTLYFYLLLIFFFAFGCDGARRADAPLAIIGDRVITKDSFVKRYKDFRRRTGEGVQDTYAARRSVLNGYVDEEILLVEAVRQGLDDDSASRQERERIEMQELLNAFNREMIASRIDVSEAELKELFVRFNTRIKARHLYAPTRSRAEALYLALKNGATFQSLAKDVFEDPRLRDTGGLVGDFTVDDMEPAFEEAAFDLAIGEISRPVKTSDGYSIIKVESKVQNPLVTETEFAKHKHKLYPYWRNRKIKRAIQSFTDSLARSLEISFTDLNVQALFDEIHDKDLSDSGENSTIRLSPKAVLARTRLGQWTVRAFREAARFTSEKQRAWIRTQEQLKEFITGLIVRSRVLRLARDAQLDRRQEYVQKVAEKWDTYLLRRMEEVLKDQFVVPDDSLRAYYLEHPEQFVSEPEINLREIVLSNRKDAAVVNDLLKRGTPFSEVARQYSERRSTAKAGGELGFLSPTDFGKWSQMVFSMKPGDTKGPVKMDSKFVFLKCIGVRDGSALSFEEARVQVETAVKFAMWDAYRQQRVTAIRKTIDKVSVFAERLKEIRLQ